MITALLLATLAADPPVPRSVHLSGVLASTTPGPFRVEVLLPQPDDGPPLLAWAGVLSKAGPFELEIPSDLGEVRLRVAADREGDGIGADDAQAVFPLPISVGRQDVTGIELNLIRPDLPRLPGSTPSPMSP